LLVPALAKRLFKDRELPGGDRESWKRFQGTTMVGIDGVDFGPYVDLLLKPVNGSRIADRVVVVTDKDPHAPGDRRQALNDRAQGYDAAAVFDVFENAGTLEETLYLPENEILLKAAYLDLHPRSAAKWKDRVEDKLPAERPAAFLAFFTSESTPVRKGDYAQALANRLENDAGDDVPFFLVPEHDENTKELVLAQACTDYAAARQGFKVPDYLENAIRALVQ